MKSYCDYVNQVRAQIDEISLAQLPAWQSQGAVLIDVREPAEWQAGNIPGALHIPRGVLEGKIESLSVFEGVDASQQRARPIVLYCHSGARSALAAQSLKQMGFTQVMSLAEGYKGWAESSS